MAFADSFRFKMPKREELAGNKYLAPIAHRFLSPELWRFNRRSVPTGVALGLFCAFIIPAGQILLAVFVALPLRANVPLAAAVTLVTNPFTLPLWAVLANKIGKLVLNIDAQVGGGIANDELASGRWAWLVDWFQIAAVTVFGFGVLAIVTSALGYLLSGWIWRFMVSRRRTRRLKRMEERLDERLETGKG